MQRRDFLKQAGMVGAAFAVAFIARPGAIRKEALASQALPAPGWTLAKRGQSGVRSHPNGPGVHFGVAGATVSEMAGILQGLPGPCYAWGSGWDHGSPSNPTPNWDPAKYTVFMVRPDDTLNDHWPGDAAAQYPGRYWILGNEPDALAGQGGDNQAPDQFAEWYAQVYDNIKQNDPTAVVVMGAISQIPTVKWTVSPDNPCAPGSKEAYAWDFMRSYTATYQSPPSTDRLSFHAYAWKGPMNSDDNVQQNVQQIQDVVSEWRSFWYAFDQSNGTDYSKKPALITEMGYGSSGADQPEYVGAFMSEVVDWLQSQSCEGTPAPIEDWFWFCGHSNDASPGASFPLIDDRNQALTDAGRKYVELASGTYAADASCPGDQAASEDADTDGG